MPLSLNIKPPSQLTIHNAKCKGIQLMAKIKQGNNKETKFPNFSDLQAEGWKVSETPEQGMLNLGMQGPTKHYGWESKYLSWEAGHIETTEDPEWKSAEYALKFNVKNGVFASTLWKDNTSSLYMMFTLDEMTASQNPDPDPDTAMPDAPRLENPDVPMPDADGDVPMPDAPPPQRRRRLGRV